MTVTKAVPDIHVAAGVLRDQENRILITQRPPSVPLAGAWEFPGGKIGIGESPLQGLVRELNEELNVQVLYARHLTRYSHTDHERRIYLYVWHVIDWAGQPSGAEGQVLRWLPVDQLMVEGLLPADKRIVDCLLQPTAVNTCGNFSAAVAGS
jgi:8-oxo-dGTP diphosphatase